MIFLNNAKTYSTYGTELPDCKSVPFDGGSNKMNIGGLGFSISTNQAVRVVGVKLDGTEYFFPNPVVFIDRTLYGTSGVLPNASELVGNAMRSLYFDEFALEEIPFLFTCGYDSVLLKNYTAHAIDNSSISGLTNTSAYMIYQFKDNLGVWGSNYGSGTYNILATASLAIESDIDPYMRCSLENILNIEIKSLYTNTPDIILSGMPINPFNITILLTYVSHLSSAFIDQLFYPVLQLGTATGCIINNIGTVNMSITLKNQLQSLGWIVNF